jgi:outer membrane protein assembly factor BamA
MTNTNYSYNRIFFTVLLLLFQCAVLAQKVDKPIKKISFAAVPIINYNRTLGMTIGGMGQMFYKIDKNDTISPSSSSGVMGIYTTNKSYMAIGFQRLYLNEDKWRLVFAAGTGDINYQYWQDVPTDEGGFIGYDTNLSFVVLRAERKVYKKLYAGVIATANTAKSYFDVPEDYPDSLKYDKRNMNNLAYILNYDNRDHQMNPYKGFNVVFRNNFYRDWIGSDNKFNKYELTYNHFFKLKNERNILATRFAFKASTGDVPFQGENVVGQDDIRGYTDGKHRNDQIYAIQSEYRWRFYKKFGMVGFAGLATAVKNFDDIPKSEILPGAGLGLRYMMIPKERINVGFDVAVGREDWGLYFRIGESFGR